MIILGVKKAGTRALLEILRLHPNVTGADQEVYFFNGLYEKGMEWYRDQMPKSLPSQITIEKSPTYFTSSEHTRTVQKMFLYSRALLGGLKLVVVVRDPTRRAVSDYTELISKMDGKGKKFEDLILKNNGTEVDRDSQIVKIGMYAEHLAKWLKHFELKDFYFVRGENLVKEPLKEVRKLVKFLSLRPFFKEQNFYFNRAKGFPCFISSDADTAPKTFCLPGNKGRKHASIKRETLTLLREFYEPLNRQFYKAVKRNFYW